MEAGDSDPAPPEIVVSEDVPDVVVTGEAGASTGNFELIFLFLKH